MKRLYSIISLWVFACVAITAQTVLRGHVVSQATGQPFAGAQIQETGTQNAAMSDADGTFTLTLSRTDGVLRVEAPGCDLQLVPVQGKKEITIQLVRQTADPFYDRESLSAGTTTTYWRQVGREESKEMTLSPETDISRRLSGVVRSSAHSGIDAGGAATFYGGIHSLLQQSQPLYVVDGIIWQRQDVQSSLHEGYFSNPLALISPDDIESIQVLRDGTALYGAKASGGVVLINTRRAHDMATQITVNLSAGVKTKVHGVPMMNAADYRLYATDVMRGMENASQLQSQMHFLNDDSASPYYLTSHNQTDWLDAVSQTGMTQNYGISVRGGDDVALYAFSLGYAKNEGSLRNSDFGRLNVRFNSDINLTKKFTTRADIAFAQVERRLFNDGLNAYSAPYFMALTKSPLYHPYQYNISGSLFDSLSDTDELGSGNPKAITENAEGKTKNYRFTASLAPRYEISENFSLSALAGFSWDKIKESNFLPDFGLAERELHNEQGELFGIGQNYVSSLMTRHSSLLLDLHADWATSRIPLSTFSIKAGFRFQNDTFQSDFGSGWNTGSDNLRSLYVTNSALRTIGGADDDWRTMAWYAKADYALLNRYFLSAALSLESNSRFGHHADGAIHLGGVSWGLFPSMTAAWVVTNEQWMNHLRGIDYLKLHASYDITGNDELPANATRTYFDGINHVGHANGLTLANIGNDHLKWERTQTLSAGIDMRLLRNRLSLAANLWWSTTDDLLVAKRLPEEFGLMSYYANDGRLENRGVDFSVRARLIDTRQWRLLLNATMGHYNNEVTHLADGAFVTKAFGGDILTQEGHSLGVFYGMKSLGVFSTQAEAEAAGLAVVDATGRRIAFSAGDVHFDDLDGNGIIDEHDRQIIGNPNPDIYGHFGFNLEWKRLTLSATLTYSLGNDAFNAQRMLLESGSSLQNQTEAMRRRWIADGQTTDIPRAVYGDPMGNARFSDRFIEDASYLKLHTLSLSYELPRFAKFLQGATLWAAANNLFTLTRYLGADPEFSYGSTPLLQGIDAGLLPSARSYQIGIKLNL